MKWCKERVQRQDTKGAKAVWSEKLQRQGAKVQRQSPKTGLKGGKGTL